MVTSSSVWNGLPVLSLDEAVSPPLPPTSPFPLHLISSNSLFPSRVLHLQISHTTHYDDMKNP
ncbi:hypothetical protein I7I51_06385 [Histoplasma capsulatum]|uniref:Uncharacterized protein n=1 Tax=Ajellomyces capsulatus TaxID=5037 RepID=A0A8A1MHP5_AJECA|nr:hypothetical protein I7I51_06385 [Histoplasma capsulatum]